MKYYKRCLEQINSKYSQDTEINKCNVIDICDLCIETLVQDFTTLLDRYRNPQDIFQFIQLYSELATEKQRTEDMLILMQMCRYIFMLIPKLELSYGAASMIDIEKKDFSDLLYISKMIDTLAQQRAIQMMSKECIFQLERNEYAFALTYLDDSFANVHTLLKQAIQGKRLFQKHCFTSNLLRTFSNELYNAFGNVTDKLNDTIFNTQSTGICIDNISFIEFKEILEGRIPERIQLFRVINVSKLFIEYPNNNFLQGLTFSSDNSDINAAIKKPYDINIRTRFRPIIEFHIDGITEYYIAPYMFQEATEEICGNLLPFKEMPEEWSKTQEIINFSNSLFRQHDKWLEELVREILELKGFPYLRNKESINNISLLKAISYIGSNCYSNCRVGEIDFVAMNISKQTIYVIDAKHMKTRYHLQSFAADQSRFCKEKGYEDKLSFKVDWIEKHLSDIGKEFKCNCSSFSVQGLFVTETFVYYSMHSKFPIIPIAYLERYFNSNDKICFLR